IRREGANCSQGYVRRLAWRLDGFQTKVWRIPSVNAREAEGIDQERGRLHTHELATGNGVVDDPLRGCHNRYERSDSDRRPENNVKNIGEQCQANEAEGH